MRAYRYIVHVFAYIFFEHTPHTTHDTHATTTMLRYEYARIQISGRELLFTPALPSVIFPNRKRLYLVLDFRPYLYPVVFAFVLLLAYAHTAINVNLCRRLPPSGCSL